MTTKQIEELREIGHRAHLHMAQLACLPVFECDDLDDEPSAFRELPDRLAFEINDTLGAIRDLAKTLTERSTPESEEAAREVLADEYERGGDSYSAMLVRRGEPDFLEDMVIRAMLRFAQQPAKSAEPTEAMIEAGASAVENYKYDEGHKPFQTLYDLYAAMLSASPDRGEG